MIATFFSSPDKLSLVSPIEEPLSLLGVVATLSSPLIIVSSTSSPKIRLIFFNRRLFVSGLVSGSYLKIDYNSLSINDVVTPMDSILIPNNSFRLKS